MKILIIHLFNLSLIISHTYAQQPDFFPIQIGNEYQMYDGFGYQFGRIERDTIYPNEKTYLHLPSPFDFQDCRVDSNGDIYSISRPFFLVSPPDEYLLFKANAIVDENWVIADSIDPLGHIGYGRCIYDDSLFVFNMQRRVKGVLIYDETYYYYFFWLAEGIGLIREQYDDGTTADLNYAKINGIEYGTLVSVEEGVPSFPSKFNVSQNYPNPFNGKTKIDITPSKSNFYIKLLIYNILGSEIYTEEIFINGPTTLTIDTEKLKLSSGSYYYSIISDNSIITKKFLLLK